MPGPLAWHVGRRGYPGTGAVHMGLLLVHGQRVIALKLAQLVLFYAALVVGLLELPAKSPQLRVSSGVSILSTSAPLKPDVRSLQCALACFPPPRERAEAIFGSTFQRSGEILP